MSLLLLRRSPSTKLLVQRHGQFGGQQLRLPRVQVRLLRQSFNCLDEALNSRVKPATPPTAPVSP
ncbi:MAG: hypothetical protein OXN89_12245 [Bryobacterales bacterium]|nr:hypothetical protein [Bryobacterales bacterium]